MPGTVNTSGSWNAAQLLLLVPLAIVAWPQAAFAYRPFDSTDPAVANPGEFEIELSPISFRRDDAGRTWIAPQLRLNYGFARNWEIVLEGQGEHPKSGGASTLVDNALSLKTIVREGTLQGKSGLSLATELGVLLPGVKDEPGTGLSFAGIAGQEWDWGAIHFNAAASLNRDHRAEIFLGTIIEGPRDWVIRPVAEMIYERAFGATEVVSFLAGVIWEAKENLAFDFAVRRASVNSAPETEFRMGLTFAFSTR